MPILFLPIYWVLIRVLMAISLLAYAILARIAILCDSKCFWRIFALFWTGIARSVVCLVIMLCTSTMRCGWFILTRRPPMRRRTLLVLTFWSIAGIKIGVIFLSIRIRMRRWILLETTESGIGVISVGGIPIIRLSPRASWRRFVFLLLVVTMLILMMTILGGSETLLIRLRLRSRLRMRLRFPILILRRVWSAGWCIGIAIGRRRLCFGPIRFFFLECLFCFAKQFIINSALLCIVQNISDIVQICGIFCCFLFILFVRLFVGMHFPDKSNVCLANFFRVCILVYTENLIVVYKRNIIETKCPFAKGHHSVMLFQCFIGRRCGMTTGDEIDRFLLLVLVFILSDAKRWFLLSDLCLLKPCFLSPYPIASKKSQEEFKVEGTKK